MIAKLKELKRSEEMKKEYWFVIILLIGIAVIIGFF
jgi:uncharacterized membrane protein